MPNRLVIVIPAVLRRSLGLSTLPKKGQRYTIPGLASSERPDAVVMSLGTAHHALPLPVLDGDFHQLRTWSAQSVEGAGWDLAIKLSAARLLRHPSNASIGPSGLLGVFAMIGGRRTSAALATWSLPSHAM
jgi:hypothetical protein